ncbi:HupE/UreJ family protein [Aestuariivirga sp.]|uniref:HupE/UreJ family protein n=1 Tax=Aestuariivirga sp. TaxID=2650926 RepID=UPI00391AC2D4
MRLWQLLLVLLPLLAGGPAAAHELRPAYLDLREVAPNELTVLWKVPALGQMRLGLHARFPENCVRKTEPARSIETGAYLERWTTYCSGGLKGRTITIDGLSSTMTDALVHITYIDGATEIARLTPDLPSLTVAGQQTTLDVAATYFVLGVEHILSGFDHLLFVLALILLIHDLKQLLKTITAFTVAHSITLAGSALGYLNLPQPPVEAIIALSIAFVASEILKSDPKASRLSERYTWVVAFAFGLLHGFGFAGALKEIGLPHSDIPMALLTFNLGVEAGQLIFIVAVLTVFAASKAMLGTIPSISRAAAAYAIGITATFWLISRLWTFGG